jgi:endonuclease-3
LTPIPDTPLSNHDNPVPSSPPKRRRTTDNRKGSNGDDYENTLLPACVTPTKAKRGEENSSKGLFMPPGLVTPPPALVVKKKSSPQRNKAKNKKPPQQRSAPLDWEATFELVHELRADRTAPVDSDGAEQLGQEELGPKVWRFQVLVGLLLSSQTKDAVVGDAMRALQQHGLTVEHIHHDTSHEQLNALIGKVGFHNNKTKYLKHIVELLLRDHGGDIPTTAADMMTLPGMGPKMSFLVETIAWNVTTGIGVDTHMHRMFNQLQYVDSKNPEQTRQQLESWLPRDQWSSVNLIWVGFGQEIQQQKEKSLRKALSCNRPIQALTLLKQLDFPISKEAKKYGLEEEVSNVMNDIQANH